MNPHSLVELYRHAVLIYHENAKMPHTKKKGMWLINTLSTFLRWHYPDQVKGQRIGSLSQPAIAQHP